MRNQRQRQRQRRKHTQTQTQTRDKDILRQTRGWRDIDGDRDRDTIKDNDKDDSRTTDVQIKDEGGNVDRDRSTTDACRSRDSDKCNDRGKNNEQSET